VNSGSGFVDATSRPNAHEWNPPTPLRFGARMWLRWRRRDVDQVTVDVGGQITTTAVLTVPMARGTDLDVFGT